MSKADEDKDEAMAKDQQDINTTVNSGMLLDQDKLDILHNITLDIRVEIGRAKVKIKDVLDLKKGMILELEQYADEPLSIYANDKVIAKGTIISANGRYCIKII